VPDCLEEARLSSARGRKPFSESAEMKTFPWDDRAPGNASICLLAVQSRAHLRAAGRPREARPAPAPALAPAPAAFLRASTRRIHSGVCSSSRSFHCETAFSSSVTISSSVERRTPVGVMTRPENAGCTEVTKRNF
jgi:hypothetical protein